MDFGPESSNSFIIPLWSGIIGPSSLSSNEWKKKKQLRDFNWSQHWHNSAFRHPPSFHLPSHPLKGKKSHLCLWLLPLLKMDGLGPLVKLDPACSAARRVMQECETQASEGGQSWPDHVFTGWDRASFPEIIHLLLLCLTDLMGSKADWPNSSCSFPPRGAQKCNLLQRGGR